MRTTPLPTGQQIDAMLALGAPLSAVSANDIPWESGSGLPWPRYPTALEDFFHAASHDPWAAYDYDPARDGDILRDPVLLARADLATLRRLLTWMVRGERFCDGHWGAMVSEGHLQRWLDRLQQLAR